MSPGGGCFPQALSLYWQMLDTPEAGPRSVEGLVNEVRLQTLLCHFILVA